MKFKNNKVVNKKIWKIIHNKMIIPQFGNNRSFACNKTKRIWKCNKQKISLDGKSLFIPRKILKIIKKLNY